MKKSIILCVAAILLLLATTTATYAEDPRLTVVNSGPEFVAPGAEFDILVGVEDAVDIVGFQMKIHYDLTQFELIAIVQSGNLAAKLNQTSDETTGTITVNYLDITDTLAGAEDLFTITFKAASDVAEGPHTVLWESMEYTNEFVSWDGISNPVKISSDEFDFALDCEVSKGLYGDVSQDGEISILDAAMIQLYLSEQIVLSSTELELADYNLDGEVTISDAALIQADLLDVE